MDLRISCKICSTAAGIVLSGKLKLVNLRKYLNVKQLVINNLIYLTEKGGNRIQKLNKIQSVQNNDCEINFMYCSYSLDEQIWVKFLRVFVNPHF